MSCCCDPCRAKQSHEAWRRNSCYYQEDMTDRQTDTQHICTDRQTVRHTVIHRETNRQTCTHSPLISRRSKHGWTVLYPTQYPTALPVSLINHQHLISIQGIGILHLSTLHTQRVHKDGAWPEGERDNSEFMEHGLRVREVIVSLWSMA